MRSIYRVAAVAAAATIPIVGLSAASATAKPKPKPAATPQIMITCSPNPVVETSTSNVAVVCQVEANPSFAGKKVTISSTQLAARCETTFAVVFPTSTGIVPPVPLTLPLDNDGNATVTVLGEDCAPGSALVTADVDSPPFSTAITKLLMESPQVTPPGVHAFPNPEVEVGDSTVAVGASANTASEVEVVFLVETNPVYAEQSLNLTSDQLTERCGTGWLWLASPNGSWQFATPGPPAGYVPLGGAGTHGVVATSNVDNDGNAAFTFFGGSCAAGKSTVIAEILAGGPTYSTQFNILPPAVTI